MKESKVNSLKILYACFIALMVVAVGCAGSALNKAKETNTVAAYDEFLKKYGDSEYASEVKELREESWFAEAKAANTDEAYMGYLAEYPRGKYTAEAKRLREPFVWQNAQRQNNIQAYDKYLYAYPDGPNAFKAKDNRENLLWREVSEDMTIAGLDDYIQQYPQGKYLAEAKTARENLLWQKTQATNTVEAFKEYLDEYPYGRYLTEAKLKIEDLIWEKAVSQNTNDGFDEYLKLYPYGRYVSQAIGRRVSEISYQTICELAGTTNDLKRKLEWPKYQGKYVKWSGYVNDADEEGRVRVFVNQSDAASDKPARGVCTIHLLFEPDQFQEVAALEKMQKITFWARLSELKYYGGLSLYIDLVDIEILQR